MKKYFLLSLFLFISAFSISCQNYVPLLSPKTDFSLIAAMSFVSVPINESGFCDGVDYQGNIYVTDYTNNNVEKYSSNGIFLNQWGSGTGLSKAEGIAFSGFGIFVADNGHERIQVFDYDDNFIREFNGGNGGFNGLTGLAADSNGNIYAADSANNRVQKFDYQGNFITAWEAMEVETANSFIPNIFL